MKSDSQPVAFSSEPEGATVSINGVPRGITPVTIMMERKYGAQMVMMALDGYQTEQFKLQKHVAGMTFGNIIFGGIIGVGVDVATGKATNYQESVQVKLIRLPGTPDGSKIPVAAQPRSVEERLKELESLHKEGLITDETYEKRREEILKSL